MVRVVSWDDEDKESKAPLSFKQHNVPFMVIATGSGLGWSIESRRRVGEFNTARKSESQTTAQFSVETSPAAYRCGAAGRMSVLQIFTC